MLKVQKVRMVFILLTGAIILYDFSQEVSVWFYIALAAAYIAIHAYGSSVLSAEFFTAVRWKGNDASNCIALTFDDGPVAGKTEDILSILSARNVQAAFFCVGHRVEKNSSIIERLHRSGHLVCNHSYWHKSTFDLQSATAIRLELQATDDIIKRIIGKKPNFFRPPFGVTNPMVAKAIAKQKYTTVGWSIRSLDTAITDSTKLLKRIQTNLKSGDIILLHDHGKATIEILPTLLDYVATVGLKIVRLDQLINEEAYV